MAQNIDLTDIRFITGSGAPSATAPKGSFYINLTASTNITRAYLNTDGATTWTAMNTVA